ncbi:hypothetical protein [Azorhizophilus paspali]|uniref:Baseplate protein J-like barrel domain-containing protein n=1 Tax=Azorhizophilus paspali TaxID=69963 RepID=A0ABV6SHK0_AZOPA
MASYDYITSTGLVLPDTGELRQEVEGEWRDAFGQDLVTSPETPQGVLITAEVEARDAVVRNNAELANQINPDYASGIFLDAIWALTGGARLPATYSQVAGVVLSGTPGTIIQAGAEIASVTTGAVFRLLGTVQLGAGGAATGSFACIYQGPIGAPPGTLTEIRTAVLGWETVTNPTAAVLGVLEESDTAARRRRRLTLALQGRQTPEAVQSLLADLPSYRSHTFRENVTNAPLTIDGVTLAPHSIYVCADGATDADVAAALLEAKGDGCAWNGGTTVNVIEPISGQSYAVQFDRPAVIGVFVRVTARFNGLDGQTIIEDAIEQYASGTMAGETGLVVGGSLSPFELAGAVNRVEPRIFVTLVELSTDGINYAVQTIAANVSQLIAISNVQVVEI